MYYEQSLIAVCHVFSFILVLPLSVQLYNLCMFETLLNSAWVVGPLSGS